MLKSLGGPLDIRRPYLASDAAVELHRIGPASLALPYRRWHVVTIPLAPAAIARSDGHRNRRGRYEPGDVGVYPAGRGESVAWPEGIHAIHVHLNPARFGGRVDLTYRFRTRDRALATIGRGLQDLLDVRADAHQIRDALAVLTDHLRERYAEERAVIPAPRLGVLDIETILELMDTHSSAGIRVTDLAERAGLTRFQFTRAFQGLMGLGPAQYLLRRRIELARHALEQEGRSIASIALESGFSDQSHLTRAFRAFAGTTPGRFRIRTRRRPHPG